MFVREGFICDLYSFADDFRLLARALGQMLRLFWVVLELQIALCLLDVFIRSIVPDAQSLVVSRYCGGYMLNI